MADDKKQGSDSESPRVLAASSFSDREDIAKQQEREDKQRHKYNEDLAVQAQLTQSEAAATQTRTNRVSLYLTGGILVATVAAFMISTMQSCISNRMLAEMRSSSAQTDRLICATSDLARQAARQASASEKSAQSAEDTSKTEQATLRSYQRAAETASRPYITIRKAWLMNKFGPKEVIKIGAAVRNGGSTPAFGLKMNTATEFVQRNSAWKFPKPSSQVFRYAMDVPPGIDRRIVVGSDRPVEPAMLKSLLDKSAVVYFYGEYTYSSLSKHYGPYKFCFYDDPLDDPNGALSVCQIEEYEVPVPVK